MDRKLGGLILMTLAFPAGAVDLTKVSVQQLCIDLAAAILTGEPTRMGFMQSATAEELGNQVIAQNANCEPQETYMAEAKYRIERRDRRKAMAGALSDGLRQMNPPRQYVPPPQVQTPKTTDCNVNGNNISCTTWP